MKLILAIVPDPRAGDILSALTAEGYRATRVSTTGGFMQRGKATLLIGVEAERVNAALDRIRATCQKDEHRAGSPNGAIVFLFDVERFEQF